MSTLLDQASLVLIPSGYKEDIVYSQKPTDGSGDLTFTRASDGTRVNSAGYVENVPWNLLQYSQDLTNAVWSPYVYGGASLTTTGSQTDPFGGSNAQKLDIVIGTGGFLLTQNLTVVPSVSYTLSVWLKGAVGGEKIVICLKNTGSQGPTGPTWTLTTDWALYEATITNDTGTARGFQFRAAVSELPSGGTIYAYGAQAVLGSTAKPYFPTTDRQNVPRLTYEGGCPSLLLEPQRTNSVTYSEQFDNAAWTKASATITANATISPDGTQNADKLVESATSAIHYCETAVSVISGQSYSYSVYAKQGERHITLQGSATPTNSAYATFNLSTGVVGASAVGSASIVDAGNGWYRCTLTFTSAATSGANMAVLLADSPTAGRSSSYSGDGTSGVFLWGAQLEAGSYATSYIPTTSASVTRVADAAIKTNFSGLSSQAELTLYSEFNFEQSNRVIAIGDGSTNNRLFVSYTTNKEIQLYLTIAGSNIFFLTSSSNVLVTGKNKVAAKIKSGATLLYVNGVQIFNNTATFTLSNMTNVFVGTNEFGAVNDSQKINSSLIFYSALTNAELASLTTL